MGMIFAGENVYTVRMSYTISSLFRKTKGAVILYESIWIALMRDDNKRFEQICVTIKCLHLIRTISIQSAKYKMWRQILLLHILVVLKRMSWLCLHFTLPHNRRDKSSITLIFFYLLEHYYCHHELVNEPARWWYYCCRFNHCIGPINIFLKKVC